MDECKCEDGECDCGEWEFNDESPELQERVPEEEGYCCEPGCDCERV